MRHWITSFQLVDDGNKVGRIRRKSRARNPGNGAFRPICCSRSTDKICHVRKAGRPDRAANAAQADLIGKLPNGRPSGWADIHPTMLHAKADQSVYVIGDAMGAVSPQFGHYPKSGHVANCMGRIVATYIAQRIAGQEVKVLLPDNLCYMLVNGSPREAISVEFSYELQPDGIIKQTQNDIDLRSPDPMDDDFKWAKRMYDDFLTA